MSYEGAIAVVLTHLDTVGGQLDPTVPRVRRGALAAPPSTPLLAVWYEGDQESHTGGHTLGKTNHEERLTIAGMWPLSSDADSLAAEADKQIAAAVQAIRSRLWGDWSLGGNVIGLTVEQAQSGFVLFDNMALVRGFELPILLDFAETGDITQ